MYLDVPLSVQQQVLELQVAVDDALSVQVGDGGRDLGAVESTALLAKLPVPLQMVEHLVVEKVSECADQYV